MTGFIGTKHKLVGLETVPTISGDPGVLRQINTTNLMSNHFGGGAYYYYGGP